MLSGIYEAAHPLSRLDWPSSKVLPPVQTATHLSHGTHIGLLMPPAVGLFNSE
jgi:hypothetical protein